MEEEGIVENAARVGDHLKQSLQTALSGVAGVLEVRGQGLMLGIALDRPAGALLQKFADAGLLVSIQADTVVRLVPPLIITEAECDQLVALLLPVLKEFLAQPG